MASLRAMRVSRWGLGLSTVSGTSWTILPSAVDLDDPPVAGLGDHGQAVVEPLEGVDLDRPVVARPSASTCTSRRPSCRASSRRRSRRRTWNRMLPFGRRARSWTRRAGSAISHSTLPCGVDDRDLALVGAEDAVGRAESAGRRRRERRATGEDQRRDEASCEMRHRDGVQGDGWRSVAMSSTAQAMICWIGSAPSTPTSFWSRPL